MYKDDVVVIYVTKDTRKQLDLLKKKLKLKNKDQVVKMLIDSCIKK